MLRVVLPLQRCLNASDGACALDQSKRRHQTGIRQRLQGCLLVRVEVDDAAGGTKEDTDDAVATRRAPGNAGLAIYVQYVHPDSFLIPSA